MAVEANIVPGGLVLVRRLVLIRRVPERRVFRVSVMGRSLLNCVCSLRLVMWTCRSLFL